MARKIRGLNLGQSAIEQRNADLWNNLFTTLARQRGDAASTTRSAHSEYYKELNAGVNSLYDEGELEYYQKRASNYLAKNRQNMDDVDIDKFERLNEKYEHQTKLNQDYDMQKKRAYGVKAVDGFDGFSQQIINLGDQYIGADSMLEFEGFSMPKAADYDLATDEGKESYNKDYDFYEENLYKKRDEYKRDITEQMKAVTGAYAQFEDELRLKHGARLDSAYASDDNNEFGALNYVYQFAVNSIADDGMLDSEEKAAYNFAIESKKYQPIKDYLIREAEMQKGKRETLFDSMEGYVYTGELAQESLDKFQEVERVDDINSEKWLLKEKQTAIQIPTGTKDEYDTYTYEDIYNALEEGDINNPILVYRRQLMTTQQHAINQLKIKEKLYKTDAGGLSYLQGVNTTNENWNKMLKGAIKDEVITTGVAAPERIGGKPLDPLPPSPTPTPYSALNVKDYTKNLVKYKSSTTSMVNQVNKISGLIDSWETDVDEMEKYTGSKLKEHQDISEEESMLKNQGVGYFSKDRKELRDKASKLKNQYDNIFNNTPQGSSHIKSMRKLVEEGELPSWVPEVAVEAFKKGISIKQYLEYMKTPAYDKFLDLKLDKLKGDYNKKKERLESIVARGSRK